MDFNKPLVYNPNVDLTDYQPNNLFQPEMPSPPQQQYYQQQIPPQQYYQQEIPQQQYTRRQPEQFYPPPEYYSPPPKPAKKSKKRVEKMRVKKIRFALIKQFLILVLLYSVFGHEIATHFIIPKIPYVSINDTIVKNLILGSIYSIIILVLLKYSFNSLYDKNKYNSINIYFSLYPGML